MRLCVYPVVFRYVESSVGPISVVGSFNHWDSATHPLTQRNGEWGITLFLPAGTYPYAFVVGDRLIPDPDPTKTLRGPLGSHYSMLVVPGEPSPARAA